MVVPTTAAQQEELLNQRPIAWEYLLWAGVLAAGMKGRRPAAGGEPAVAPPIEGAAVDRDLATSFLSARTSELKELVAAVTLLFEPDVQEDAFGAPGEPGDPTKIRALAEQLLAVHDQLVEWATSVRAARPASPYRSLFQATATMAEAPIEQIRSFVDLVVEQMSELPPEPPTDGSQRVLEATLTLEMDPQVMNRLEAEFAVLSRLL